MAGTSPHTIRSQMKSVYRKLDVSSRHQAVTRARELRLLES
jgi:LuxR family maltose regulon positive regulatory protein